MTRRPARLATEKAPGSCREAVRAGSPRDEKAPGRFPGAHVGRHGSARTALAGVRRVEGLERVGVEAADESHDRGHASMVADFLERSKRAGPDRAMTSSRDGRHSRKGSVTMRSSVSASCSWRVRAGPRCAAHAASMARTTGEAQLDQLAAGVGDGDQPGPPVGWVRNPGDVPGQFELVEDRARGSACSAGRPRRARRAATRRARCVGRRGPG